MFQRQPFPQGHPVKTFLWSGEIDPGRGLIFHFHLVTEDYNIAPTYAGDMDFDYGFEANISHISSDGI